MQEQREKQRLRRELWHQMKDLGQVNQQLKPQLLPSPTWQSPKSRKASSSMPPLLKLVLFFFFFFCLLQVGEDGFGTKSSQWQLENMLRHWLVLYRCGQRKKTGSCSDFLAVDRFEVAGQPHLPGLLDRVSPFDFLLRYSCRQRFVGPTFFMKTIK
ncbi:hypothetical protein ACSQ67_000979 [Phaseolus vulgaris]